jgi:Tfp pilus assembly protein PilN
LPEDYKLAEKKKNVRMLYWLSLALLLLCGLWPIYNAKVQIYRHREDLLTLQRELDGLEEELASGRAFYRESQQVLQRLEVLQRWKGDNLPWLTFLGDVKKNGSFIVSLREIKLMPEGQIIIEGRGENYTEIAEFLQALNELTYLTEIQLNLVEAREGEKIKFLIGATSTIGEKKSGDIF